MFDWMSARNFCTSCTGSCNNASRAPGKPTYYSGYATELPRYYSIKLCEGVTRAMERKAPQRSDVRTSIDCNPQKSSWIGQSFSLQKEKSDLSCRYITIHPLLVSGGSNLIWAIPFITNPHIMKQQSIFLSHHFQVPIAIITLN